MHVHGNQEYMLLAASRKICKIHVECTNAMHALNSENMSDNPKYHKKRKKGARSNFTRRKNLDIIGCREVCS